MSQNMPNTPTRTSLSNDGHRLRCNHPNCNKSYLRLEHLNRHRLTHGQSAFLCYQCSKSFTRNDLLHAHLRRHEKRLHRTSKPPVTASPGHSDATSPDQECTLNTPAPRPENKGKTAAVSFMPGNGVEESNLPYLNSFPAQRSLYLDSAESSDGPQPLMNTSNGPLTSISVFDDLQMTDPTEQLALADPAGGPVQDEFTWLFQEQGLFGLPDNNYFSFPEDDFINNIPDMRPQDNNIGALNNEQIGGPSAPIGSSLNFRNTETTEFSPLDYQKLCVELPDIESLPYCDSSSLLHHFNLGLDYTDVCMPFFHRPTINISSLPAPLTLAICCLGIFVKGARDYHETGQTIYKHVWRSIFVKALDLPRVDIETLKTMQDFYIHLRAVYFNLTVNRILIEHIGFYALSRFDHEMADVVHGMIVTLARRSSLLAQTFNSGRNRTLPRELKWKDWVAREAATRLAHIIFVHDIQYSIHFMHPSLISVGMLKIPLPSSPETWQATTAVEWERQMGLARQPSRARSIRSLQASIGLLFPLRSDHPSHGKREALQEFSSSPFTMQILVHGIASTVCEHRFRTVDSACAPSINLLKLGEFDEALARWHTCFYSMSKENRETESGRSALITYHFVAILLRESLSDIQMAAGTAYSWGRVVTPQRAQEAFLPLVTTNPVGRDAYCHGLKILGLCMDDTTEQLQSQRQSSPRPLYLTYNAFIGVLVLWAYALGLGREKAPQRQQSTDTFLTAMRDVRKQSNEASPSSRNDTSVLERIMEREFNKPAIKSQEVENIRSDVRLLMERVKARLTNTSWEICQEARRILDSLLERNAFVNFPENSIR